MSRHANTIYRDLRADKEKAGYNKSNPARYRNSGWLPFPKVYNTTAPSR